MGSRSNGIEKEDKAKGWEREGYSFNGAERQRKQ